MMDRFADAMIAIVREAETDIRRLKGAPYTMPVRRLDDVKAARNLDLAWKP
jgi:glycine dehydrogenase subunit 2